jgi:hypothetical protein
MIIKLTNASKEFKGDKILLNPNFIISAFEGKDDAGKKAVYIYGAQSNTWQVKESIDDIYGMLQK